MLIKYVRDENWNPFACIVAVDKNKLGVSVCHPNDSFSKEMARKIAKGRAKKQRREPYHYIPEDHDRVDDINLALVDMQRRSKQYFQ